MFYTPALYRDSLEIINRDNSPYPSLAGWADWATGYTSRLIRSGNPDLIPFALASLDDYTFASEFIKTMRSFDHGRDKWTDPEADKIGRDWQRAHADMIPANVEAPF